MKPPMNPHGNYEFEMVADDTFVIGEILDIEYDNKHQFTFQNEVKEKPAVRFVFKLEGYKHAHKSKWLTFSYNDKSNLFIKYLSELMVDAFPKMDFDLDRLKGFKVKTLWKTVDFKGRKFQDVETIRSITEKISLAKEMGEPDDVNLSAEESGEIELF